MEKRGSPYGEARRLRYFVFICEKLLKSPSVDFDFFIERLLASVERLNPRLDQYVRNTGIMKSRAVIRNYLRFADWLDLIRIEQRLVGPNGYTVFFANLEKREDFFLTEREKVAFFLHLSRFDSVVELLCSLRVKNAINEYVRRDLTEHFVETYFEWFVDLGLLSARARRFGSFDLTHLGYRVHGSCGNEMRNNIIIETYLTELLRSPIKSTSDVSKSLIWDVFVASLTKLGRYTRSQVDPSLYSALPSILELQTRLIVDHHVFMTLWELTQKRARAGTQFR